MALAVDTSVGVPQLVLSGEALSCSCCKRCVDLLDAITLLMSQEQQALSAVFSVKDFAGTETQVPVSGGISGSQGIYDKDLRLFGEAGCFRVTLNLYQVNQAAYPFGYRIKRPGSTIVQGPHIQNILYTYVLQLNVTNLCSIANPYNGTTPLCLSEPCCERFVYDSKGQEFLPWAQGGYSMPRVSYVTMYFITYVEENVALFNTGMPSIVPGFRTRIVEGPMRMVHIQTENFFKYPTMQSLYANGNQADRTTIADWYQNRANFNWIQQPGGFDSVYHHNHSPLRTLVFPAGLGKSLDAGPNDTNPRLDQGDYDYLWGLPTIDSNSLCVDSTVSYFQDGRPDDCQFYAEVSGVDDFLLNFLP